MAVLKRTEAAILRRDAALASLWRRQKLFNRRPPFRARLDFAGGDAYIGG